MSDNDKLREELARALFQADPKWRFQTFGLASNAVQQAFRSDADAILPIIDRDKQSLRDENARLLALLEATRDTLAFSGATSGYCMCGDPVEGHSIGSGHSPVDAHSYHAGNLVKQIDAALNPKEPPHDV